MSTRTMIMLLAGVVTAACAPMTPENAMATAPQAGIEAALADPARADQRDDDARRKAAEVLAFSGVKRGDIVVDFFPGSGYWTRIFSGIVGARGHVYADWPAAGAKYATKARPALETRGLANVTTEVLPTDVPTAPVPVDLFWTVQNYHDLANNGGGEAALMAFDRGVYRLLRKGGTYVVIDHVDAAGTGLSGTDTRHRIDPAAVRRQVEAAGFRFVGESPVLRNPADDHTLTVFDPAIRGHTDQFVYKFRKP
ncbi:class I SAM-dependent methyltransferase [Sphingomonas oligophenolica]|uniref:Methyltransferase n=1 Tax=Sphingomonas oligophenolica TaxID=301154 RepID=A0A502CL14_9SPHN|nr:class I SAM-dependent methyltransferase [Sphingomonas oligophenolica]TPG13608.1 methyltransferase [Sphingomonas oligophenolica]